MRLGDFELFMIDVFIVFEVNLVLVVFGQPEVILVDADGLLVFEQDIDISFPEFVWHL
jgi:hypothetical protein